MISKDEDALICDMAEYYHIYDYRALSVEYLATLVFGLRDDSRIKMAWVGAKISTDLMLQASIFDRLNLLVYMNTKDGQKGKNKPKSLLEILTNQEKKNDDVLTFASASDFDVARAKLLEEVR